MQRRVEIRVKEKLSSPLLCQGSRGYCWLLTNQSLESPYLLAEIRCVDSKSPVISGQSPDEDQEEAGRYQTSLRYSSAM